jgi:ABC-type bacteriocin/lantibiotic exporter with double-glycine peptidase domain
MEAIVWRARLDTHFLETLRGIRTIKLFNGQEERRAHWLNLLVETTNRQLTTQKLAFLFRIGNRLLMGILSILIIWMSAKQVLENTLSIGLMLAFIAYKDQFIGRVTVLIDRAVDLKMLRLHAERLADIALAEPETRTSIMPTPGGGLPPAIELRNVSFRYSEQEPWILDNVSLRIEAEESVAIIGPSGGGKSTLLKLLAGLIKPTYGEILVDGEPIARIGLENYRARIGVVMQDDQLFAGSIADNISFFAERPNHERITQSSKLAAVHDDIMAMPMGYGTLIGDMGTVLSGGQKQRVVIARALYRQPSILLLDEATSHLDIERERMVNDAFGTMRITRVVVAHRPETIRMSGRVVALKQGKVSDDNSVEHIRPTMADSHRLQGTSCSKTLEGRVDHEVENYHLRGNDASEHSTMRQVKGRSRNRNRSFRKKRALVTHATGDATPTFPMLTKTEKEVRLPKASFEMLSLSSAQLTQSQSCADAQHSGEANSQNEVAEPCPASPQNKALHCAANPNWNQLRTWGQAALTLSAYFLMMNVCS